MANTEIIKSFLVSLGFKTDEASLKKFSAGIETATKNVVKLVAAIEGAALTVGAGVAAFASNLEALYFAAQKTGASATNLKAFANAARNFGDSSEGALSSVQALARWMRTTPGSEGFLKSLGVDARDANGRLRDTTDIMVDLGHQLGKQPYYMASQYASLLGIGEDTLRAMINGDFEREMRKQQALLKDAGFEKATRDAHEFQMKLRALEARIQSIGVRIRNSLIDALGPQMDAAAKWFDKNGDQIGTTVTAIANAIIVAGSIITPILGTIADGWKNIYDWVKAAGEKINSFLPESWKEKIGAGTAWLFDKLGIGKQMEDLLVNGGSSGKPAASAPAASTNKAMAFFMRMGWSKDQAAGIVSNLSQESKLNPGAVGDHGSAVGIAQWHSDRQAAFAKWAGHDIRKSTLDEQLAFVNYEMTQGQDVGARRAGALLRAASNAQQAGEIMSRYYERPKAIESEAAMRGAAAVKIAQQTTIHVAGGDPVATAKAVAGEQDRVNQNMTRNMQVALQ